MGRGDGSSPRATEIAYSPRGGARKVEVGLDEAVPAGRGKVKAPVRVFAESFSAADAAALYRTDPDQLRRRVAEQMTGRKKGFVFNVALRSIRVERMNAHCDGCDRSFPLADSDFSGWSYDAEAAKDYCADCS